MSTVSDNAEIEQLLARYLSQTAELGGNELYLDTMTPAEFLAGLRKRMLEARGAAPEVVVPKPKPTPEPKPAVNVLSALATAASVCTLCRLCESRTNAVFGEGNQTADLLIVGEAPGESEDKTGRPFVGKAGHMLDLLLLTAGFPRETVYICNVLKCRPPGNRDPLPDEVATCTTNYLFAQLDAVAPRAILAVGKFAAQALLNSQESIGRMRGTTHTYRGTPMIVTYHPAFLLRSPQMVRAAWDDLQAVRKVLDGQV